MQTLTIVIAFVLVFLGSVVNQKKNESGVENVQGETTTPTEIHPTPTPREPFEEPQDMDSGQAQMINTLQYPISRIITQSETSLTLESDGDADAITNWYKEKIKTMGMNTKSFVTTKTNGNIKNVLVGANGTAEIRVEMTKSASENSVRIVVTYRTY